MIYGSTCVVCFMEPFTFLFSYSNIEEKKNLVKKTIGKITVACLIYVSLLLPVNFFKFFFVIKELSFERDFCFRRDRAPLFE